MVQHMTSTSVKSEPAIGATVRIGMSRIAAITSSQETVAAEQVTTTIIAVVREVRPTTSEVRAPAHSATETATTTIEIEIVTVTVRESAVGVGVASANDCEIARADTRRRCRGARVAATRRPHIVATSQAQATTSIPVL